MPRLCAPVMANAGGSHFGDGARPCTPVRYRDHGSSFDGYRASASGRTWRMIAFLWIDAARSSKAMSSDFCCSVVSPLTDGQSVLSTVATHNPRNSRGIGGGCG